MQQPQATTCAQVPRQGIDYGWSARIPPDGESLHPAMPRSVARGQIQTLTNPQAYARCMAARRVAQAPRPADQPQPIPAQAVQQQPVQ
jgi:hypothetical protein